MTPLCTGFQSSDRVSVRLAARQSRSSTATSDSGPSVSRASFTAPGPIHPPPFAHMHPHPHPISIAGHSAGAYVVPVSMQSHGVGLPMPVPLVPLSLPSHPLAYAQHPSRRHQQASSQQGAITAPSPVQNQKKQGKAPVKRKRVGSTDDETSSSASPVPVEDVDQGDVPKSKRSRAKNGKPLPEFLHLFPERQYHS
jgi:hypothetical protein